MYFDLFPSKKLISYKILIFLNSPLDLDQYGKYDKKILKIKINITEKKELVGKKHPHNGFHYF